MTRTALYRHFDGAGRLLYVGISLSAVQRLAQHEQDSPWFAHIERVSIEWHETRQAALHAEKTAIGAENPLHNRWRPKRATSPTAQSKPVRMLLGVIHLGSGRIDGWYARDAEHMLGWFRVVFPQDRFALAQPEPDGDNYLNTHRSLKWSNHESWASSPPDFKAGDRYDAEAA